MNLLIMLLLDFMLGQLMMCENLIIPLFYTLFYVFYKYLNSRKIKYIILSVASVWTKEKGLEDLIALSKELKEDEHLIVVGVGKHLSKLLLS